MLELLLALLFAAIPSNLPASPVVDSYLMGDVLVSVHASTAMSALSIVPGEDVIVCSVANGEDVPQEPGPTFTATWTSAGNVVNKVTTPVPSTTPAGVARALQTHQTLVASLKQAFPPIGP